MRINDIQISKNFKLYEFECNDGSHTVKIDPRVVECVQKLRDLVNAPLHVNSGYRTPLYNHQIGGSPKSQHIEGKAVDIQLPKGFTVDGLAKLGEKAGFTGIGKYKWGCHFDVRENPIKFDYR